MKIVFIVSFPFPYGDASSIRALNLCKLIKAAGHDIHVISDYESENAKDADLYCTHEACMSKKVGLLERKVIPQNSLKALMLYCSNNKVDAILMNARYERYNLIMNFCKKNNIKLYVENCEWYNSSSFKLRHLDIRYYRNQHMIKHGFKYADGFISISRLLDAHNKSFGKKSVRIPTIMDVKSVNYKINKNNEKLKIIYTGNPGKKKEYLLPIFKVLAQNRELSDNLEFHIYGPNVKQILRNIKNKSLLKKTSGTIFIHGKVSQLLIPTIMSEADFLMFLRPYIRSSNAGFPTKFGECLATGTPAITNNTGDIELYLSDGQNGLLLKNNSVSEVENALKRVIMMSKSEKETMNLKARKTAEEHFDYLNYIDDIKYLFE